MTVTLDANKRTGKLLDGNKQYKLALVDLPCTIETHKTFDSKAFYKSNDIGQVQKPTLHSPLLETSLTRF